MSITTRMGLVFFVLAETLLTLRLAHHASRGVGDVATGLLFGGAIVCALVGIRQQRRSGCQGESCG